MRGQNRQCVCLQIGEARNGKGLGLNLFPHMPILGSSNSAANKDTVSKIWTNVDTVI